MCFRRARCLLATGRGEEARAQFVRARDLDALRFRADTRINELIRAAAERADGNSGADEGVDLLDAERLFAEHPTSTGGSPGDELFYEHVHLRPEGNYLLATALADHLARCPPPVLRGAKSTGANPPLERCCRRLALTDWDRSRMELDLLGMMQRPPFSSRMDHEAIRARWHRARERSESESARTWLKQAVPIYEDALRRAPEDVHFRGGYARVLRWLERNEEAIRLWRELLDEFPNSISWQTELGGALVAAGRPEEAVDLYREMLAAPGVPPAAMHLKIALAWIAAGQLDQAESELRQAIALDPDDLKAPNNLGAVLVLRKRYGEAEAWFRQLIREHPENDDARDNLAAALVEQGKLAEAADAYRQSIAADPSRMEPYWGLAAVLRSMGDRDGALRAHLGASRAAPDSAEAFYQLGNVEEQYGQITGAMEHYRQALRLDPAHARAGHNLGAILQRVGNIEDAMATYRRVLDHHPGFPATANNLARILACHPDPRRRDGAEAVRLMEAVCRDQNAAADEPRWLSTLAAAYAEAGRMQDAIATAEKALRLASARRDAPLAAEIEPQLRLYCQGRPFHWGATAAR